MPRQTTAPTPAPASQPIQPPAGTATPAPVTGASARVIYLGLRESREVLHNQKGRLEDEREEIVQKIRQGPASEADRVGLEQRLAAVDQQIAKVSIDIAEADARVAAGAAVPGALDEGARPNPWEYGPPEDVVMLTISFTALLLFPVAIAWARRLWKKASVVNAVPQELTDRVASMERNLETVALEIERIGEGQRFVTQLMASRAEPVRDALPEPRKP